MAVSICEAIINSIFRAKKYFAVVESIVNELTVILLAIHYDKCAVYSGLPFLKSTLHTIPRHE